MTSKDEAVELTKVLSGKAILNLQKLIRSVPVGDYVIDYVARLVRATRPKDPTAPDFVKKMVDYGAGPRAGQFLREAGKAIAAMDGRFSVAIDDIKKVGHPRAAPPRQHELPGPGRGQDQRGHHPAAARRSSANPRSASMKKESAESSPGSLLPISLRGEGIAPENHGLHG